MNDMTVVKPTISAGHAARGIIPQDFDAVWRIADAVHKSGMRSRDFKTAQEIFVVLLQGLEVGLPPMAALNGIAMINGKPAIFGNVGLGVIRASGLVDYIKEHYEGEGDDLKAVCTTLRKGESEPVTGEYSVADAKQAGLWDTRQTVKRYDKKSSGYVDRRNDAPWFRFPKRMLMWRARTVLKDTYSDALGGLTFREEFDGLASADEDMAIPVAPPAPPAIEHEVVPQTGPIEEPDIPACLDRNKAELEADDLGKFDDIVWEFGQQADGVTDEAEFEEMKSDYESRMEGASAGQWDEFNAVVDNVHKVFGVS